MHVWMAYARMQRYKDMSAQRATPCTEILTCCLCCGGQEDSKEPKSGACEEGSAGDGPTTPVPSRVGELPVELPPSMRAGAAAPSRPPLARAPPQLQGQAELQRRRARRAGGAVAAVVVVGVVAGMIFLVATTTGGSGSTGAASHGRAHGRMHACSSQHLSCMPATGELASRERPER